MLIKLFVTEVLNDKYVLHNFIIRSLMICTPHQILFADQIEKNEMGGACSTCGREVPTGFLWGNLRKRDHLEDPSVNGRIILRRIFRKLDGGA